ncbi:hypothetical protein [Streptomyces aureoverticillatus]|uniref:hypothetical protein n=1 Tax=Streptomyces aureoverticillatus TaxID=66871 RepID=UPI001EF9B6B3|nr:hypothetical protein [Streptomyces aureoverticillatus]
MRFRRKSSRTDPSAPRPLPPPESYWGHGGDYHTWVDFLRRWSTGEDGEDADLDARALPPLADGQFLGETWERLTAHLTGAVDVRLRAWAERLVRALAAAPDEFGYGRELTQARTGLREVRSVAGHSGLPAGLRTSLTELVDRHIAEIQQQLERALDDYARAGGDLAQAERRRRTLRDNPLTAATSSPAPGARSSSAAPPHGTDPWQSTDPGARPRRRVIPD